VAGRCCSGRGAGARRVGVATVAAGRAPGRCGAARRCGARGGWRWGAVALTSTSIGRLERASRGRGGRRAGCPGQALQTVHVVVEETEEVNGCAGRPACDCSRSTYRTETCDDGGAPGPLPAGPLACVFLRILTIMCTHPHHPHQQRYFPDEGGSPIARSTRIVRSGSSLIGRRSPTAVSRPSAAHPGRADRRERPSHHILIILYEWLYRQVTSPFSTGLMPLPDVAEARYVRLCKRPKSTQVDSGRRKDEVG
jgi:hypothetical protein